jgi:hypothetical protein
MLRNLFETSEFASSRNSLITNLALQRSKLTEFRALNAAGVSPAVSIPVLREAINASTEAVNIALFESGRPRQDTAGRTRGLEWKHWVKHNAWSIGAFVVMRNELLDVDPHSELAQSLFQTITENRRVIDEVKITTTDQRMDATQRDSFANNIRDLRSVSETVKSRQNKGYAPHRPSFDNRADRNL